MPEEINRVLTDHIRNIIITLRDNNLENILKSNPFVVYYENEAEEEKISKQIAAYLKNFSLREYYINYFKKKELLMLFFSKLMGVAIYKYIMIMKERS